MNISSCIELSSCARLAALRLCVGVMLCAGVLAQPAGAVDVRGGTGNVSLGAIAGTDTLVTVVLKGGAEDPNLKVLETKGDTIIFATDKGGQTVYRDADIDHLQVQGEVLPMRKPVATSSVALRPEDQRIVDAASSRAAELFQSSKDNQELRIKAAAYMAYDGNEEAAQYLTSLAESNNLQTRIEAGRALYLAGKPLPAMVIPEGLDSNNRNTKSATAVLAGLFGSAESTSTLMEMLNDRSAQFAAPAAVALARLGNREIIPSLFEMLGSTSEEKNKAGIESLVILGGQDVIDIAKHRLEDTTGLEQYRLIQVLHRLKDEDGRKQLVRVFNEQLTIKPEAALLLAADQYWEAANFLQERLKRREDDTPENLAFRARNAHAIMQGGDPSAIHVFQDLLRRDDSAIRTLVLDLIAESGERTMLKLIQTSVSNVDTELSMTACNTAMAIASPEFRQRLQDLKVSP